MLNATSETNIGMLKDTSETNIEKSNENIETVDTHFEKEEK
jgi:hypothetical protein